MIDGLYRTATPEVRCGSGSQVVDPLVGTGFLVFVRSLTSIIVWICRRGQYKRIASTRPHLWAALVEALPPGARMIGWQDGGRMCVAVDLRAQSGRNDHG